MALQNFCQLVNEIKSLHSLTISVASAEDESVLSALKDAYKEFGVKAILVGNQEEIERILKEINYWDFVLDIVSTCDKVQSAKKAVSLVREGKAHLLMKGLLQTADFLRAVLDKEEGLRIGRFLSHIFLLYLPSLQRFVGITDGGLNISPSLEEKKQIIENAVSLFYFLGYEKPKVAVLAALELVNPDMPATIDAALLSKMGERRQIKNAIIDGPFALDNALLLESAFHKKIRSEVAGKADILLVPDIEAGNILAKALIFFGNCEAAGIVWGAKVPLILTSRADSLKTKLLSIALSCFVLQRGY
ncbi:MAG: bifunctional enoyl-CoA hydratase/phosphate acetyltransferase [Dictyoglomaceae bacterium]